jgi:hypothetical protein
MSRQYPRALLAESVAAAGAWGSTLTPRTVPELLLILEVIRHLKRHAEVAGNPANASSLVVLGRLYVAAAGYRRCRAWSGLWNGKRSGAQAGGRAWHPLPFHVLSRTSATTLEQPHPLVYACSQGPGYVPILEMLKRRRRTFSVPQDRSGTLMYSIHSVANNAISQGYTLDCVL